MIEQYGSDFPIVKRAVTSDDVTALFLFRGDNQNRTGDTGVADPCLTAWLCRHVALLKVFTAPGYMQTSKSTFCKPFRLIAQHICFAFGYTVDFSICVL